MPTITDYSKNFCSYPSFAAGRISSMLCTIKIKISHLATQFFNSLSNISNIWKSSDNSIIKSQLNPAKKEIKISDIPRPNSNQFMDSEIKSQFNSAKQKIGIPHSEIPFPDINQFFEPNVGRECLKQFTHMSDHENTKWFQETRTEPTSSYDSTSRTIKFFIVNSSDKEVKIIKSKSHMLYNGIREIQAYDGTYTLTINGTPHCKFNSMDECYCIMISPSKAHERGYRVSWFATSPNPSSSLRAAFDRKPYPEYRNSSQKG